jgi:hypothetical protein
VHRTIYPEEIREPYPGRWKGDLGAKKDLIIPEGITIRVHKGGKLHLLEVSEKVSLQDLREQSLLKWGLADPQILDMAGRELSEGM